MHPIIYDVAVSVDGYIAGADGDISMFAHEGPVVADYQTRLANYAVAIMGRSTYEFGYRFGMKPGQNPYAHMQTIVFSSSVKLPDDRDVFVQNAAEKSFFEELKMTSSGPIYLCGGGVFAGALLDMGIIDIVRLKRAPVILGSGVRLFGPNASPTRFTSCEVQIYDNGYVYQEFKI